MLPRSRPPEDIYPHWAETLTRVMGNECVWRTMYQPSNQMELFNGPRLVREAGVTNLIRIYKDNLKELFGNRFLSESKTLKNSRNSSLYEFIFCVGNDTPKAISAAKKIAKHLLSM